ncbi:DUF2480 family protein [Algoriphagus namhaensis]
MSEIVNRVAKSPLVTIDLEELYPKGELVPFDLSPFLFEGLILRENEFRLALKELDWSHYSQKWVYIECSVDAIVPNWAFILVGTYLMDLAKGFVIGDRKSLEQYLVTRMIKDLDSAVVENKPVVIKGCSNLPEPLFAYGLLLEKIQPIAKSIMYGEPCSTVPLYKRPKI